MDHSELVASVATELNKPKTVVSAILASATRRIIEFVDTDGRATVKDFGIFKLRVRPARKGRNPRTGEQIDVPAKRVIEFKPLKSVRDTLEG
jgi:nucleoid DNA-binding protein